jgi:expansin (peptidoglycan-binding protein)
MRAAAAIPVLLAIGCGCNSGSPIGDDVLPCGEEEEHAGEATYYDATGGGACSFEPSPDDLMVAAANPTDFDGSAACGACAEVDGPDGTVVVRIVDLCPGCAAGDLDLSREAFALISPLAAGRVPIAWRYVPCDVDGPVRYHFKDGSNPFWTAVQVRNHRHRIIAVETRRPGEEWEALPRESYNYFVEADGFGEGTAGIRAIDVHGHIVEDEGLEHGDDVEVSGAEQLMACPD